jgi:CDP-diacylglycerol--glycerol-3-phosphate 3-phosphatidyltransferase/cardiolipin synthase
VNVTVATKITVVRILMVPVFAGYAVAYGVSVAAGEAQEMHRWIALGVFVLAAATDGVDGWVARRFDQKSELGAFLDPIADKFLLLTGVVTLALVDWGEDGWRLPLWFAAVVFLRDAMILMGIGWLYTKGLKFRITPHWIGKWCTVAQMVALGWVMLRVFPVSPVWPCAVAAGLTVISAGLYLRQGVGILRNGGV